MADLIAGSTSYPASVDTATQLNNNTDVIIAEHINGPNAAVVAIETELGTGVKGSAATLTARLSVNNGADGGIIHGTSFPVAPAATPHFFYHDTTNILYVYNPTLANYETAASSILADYVSKISNGTITAQHTFAPDIAQPPFLLGANAYDQKVPNFDADSVDGYDLDQGVKTTDSPSFPSVTTTTDVKTNTISERTAASGVTIDGVLLKDNNVTVGASGQVSTDTIVEKTAATGVTIDSVLLKDNQVSADQVNADTIAEKTSAAGVTIDGVLLKDNNVTVGTAGQIVTDTIAEKTSAAGVTIDGVLCKDNSVTVGSAGSIVTDTISEKTSAAGVTVDSCLIKDGKAADSDKIDGRHVTTFLGYLELNNGAEGTVTFSTGLGEFISGSGLPTAIIVHAAALGYTTNSHKVSWSWIAKDTPSGIHSGMFGSGGWSTAPADPSYPASGSTVVAVRNNTGAWNGIRVYLTLIN